MWKANDKEGTVYGVDNDEDDLSTTDSIDTAEEFGYQLDELFVDEPTSSTNEVSGLEETYVWTFLIDPTLLPTHTLFWF